MSDSKNIILTGVPRSGTTLICHLLNKLPDCVALHEPIIPSEFVSQVHLDAVNFIDQYFITQRQQILIEGTAISKSFDGKVPDNPVAEWDEKTGKRIRILDGRSIKINKNLDTNFLLAIKQPALFTALLRSLVESQKFKCFAIIRNPLAVWLSWNTVDMPVASGRAPGAEAFAEKLKVELNSIQDLYDRQLYLLNWFYHQYALYISKENILFYEDTIKTSGKSLSTITSSALALQESLHSKNNNHLYRQHMKELLLSKLLASKNAAYWNFYSKKDILDEC